MEKKISPICEMAWHAPSVIATKPTVLFKYWEVCYDSCRELCVELEKLKLKVKRMPSSVVVTRPVRKPKLGKNCRDLAGPSQKRHGISKNARKTENGVVVEKLC